jgi:homoaconitase/3-isopropylmalate dehydratase large subunit
VTDKESKKVLKTLTIEQRITVINMAFAQGAIMGTDPEKVGNAFVNARKKLLEEKKVKEQNGALVKV